MKIQRYEADVELDHDDAWPKMNEDESGEWVRYEDVAAAIAERDELVNRSNYLEAELPMLQDVVTSCEAEIDRLKSRITVSRSWLVEMMREASAAWLGWDKPEDNIIPRLRLIGVEVEP